MWTPYQPAWFGIDLGPQDSVLEGRYRLDGDLLNGQIRLTIGRGLPGSGTWSFSLPFEPQHRITGVASLFDRSAGTYYQGQVRQIPVVHPASVAVFVPRGVVHWGFPFAWAEGDELRLTFGPDFREMADALRYLGVTDAQDVAEGLIALGAAPARPPKVEPCPGPPECRYAPTHHHERDRLGVLRTYHGGAAPDPGPDQHDHAPGLWCDECPDAEEKRAEAERLAYWRRTDPRNGPRSRPADLDGNQR